MFFTALVVDFCFLVPDINWSICLSNESLSTLYIPPLAPSNEQFQAANACPKFSPLSSLVLFIFEKSAYPLLQREWIIPAVTQSPDPQVSITVLVEITGKCTQSVL